MRTFSFKFRITKGSAIFIGVVDKKRIKQTRSYDTQQAVSYYGTNGNKYPDRIK